MNPMGFVTTRYHTQASGARCYAHRPYHRCKLTSIILRRVRKSSRSGVGRGAVYLTLVSFSETRLRPVVCSQVSPTASFVYRSCTTSAAHPKSVRGSRLAHYLIRRRRINSTPQPPLHVRHVFTVCCPRIMCTDTTVGRLGERTPST